MKLTLNFPELNALRKKIGADESVWNSGCKPLEDIAILREELHQGKEISLADINGSPGEPFSYRGEQVIVYIKDNTHLSKEALLTTPQDGKKFHLTDCSTLEDMRSKGRFDRYVATNRMDGFFKVDWKNRESGASGETEAQLKVCKNCLSALNWQDYQNNRKRVFEVFSISEFLMEFSTFFKNRPSRLDTNTPINVYVRNWPQISESKRRAANWRCEKCKIDLSSYPRLLHCHHKNGVVTDNTIKNLVVLCALCHAAQPFHGHLKVCSEDERVIMRLRKA